VKLQVEFNPARVAAYRLVGYENRVLRHEDFRDDKKDAGDMGSGHTCTALYEIVPAGEKVDAGEVAPLKYQTAPQLSAAAKQGEWLTVRLRYKDPATDKASEVESALPGKALTQKPGHDFAFAACVASFGMLLRESEYKGSATYASVLATAEGLLREKKDAHREEFARLVRVALTIDQAKAKPAKTD
jgi:Ca-activated chloride channel family protein